MWNNVSLTEVKMRAVVQRVGEARVEVDGRIVGEIGPGLLIFLGVGEGDSENDGEYLANKIVHLRIFPDDRDLMNLSLIDTGGEALVVSQFTLWGDCRKGRRPSFTRAARPEIARQLYEGKGCEGGYRRISGDDECPSG
jgi:D-tyrosyl-tRNA(Tyr) deacylase